MMEPILLQQLDFNGKEVGKWDWKIHVLKKDEQFKFRRDELYSRSLIINHSIFLGRGEAELRGDDDNVFVIVCKCIE